MTDKTHTWNSQQGTIYRRRVGNNSSWARMCSIHSHFGDMAYSGWLSDMCEYWACYYLVNGIIVRDSEKRKLDQVFIVGVLEQY